MGTPEFSVPCLDILIKEGYKIQAVVTQPDKPKGRRMELCCPPVKKYAERNNICVLQPEKINTCQFISILKEKSPDILVAVAYGNILPQEILDIPPQGCINVHASILPKYRGAAPINWAIIRGERKTGVTTMLMDAGLDTGDILLKREIDISENMTAGELHDKLAFLGAEVLKETLWQVREGTIKRIPQNDSEATYAPMLKKEMGLIDWDRSSIDIHNLIRGTNPWPGAFTCYKGKHIKILKSSIVTKSNERTTAIKADNKRATIVPIGDGDKLELGLTEPIECENIEPGTIIQRGKDGILTACSKGCLKILELQFSGCKRLCIQECWHNFELGTRFGQ